MYSKINFFFIILSLVTLMSCGKKEGKKYEPPTGIGYSPIYTGSDPQFTQTINDFIDEHYHYTNRTLSIVDMPPINFYDLSSLTFLNNPAINISKHYFQGANNQNTMAGVCLSYSNGQREILIDETVWSLISNAPGCNGSCAERKKALIFHELGHCVLNRDHKDDLYNNFNLSIMNSILIKQSSIVRWEENYYEELFTEDHTHLQQAIHSMFPVAP